MSNLNLKKKLLLAFATILSIFGLVMFFVVNNNTKKVIVAGLTEQLKISQKMGRSLFDAKYPGDWKLHDGKLFKGEFVINDNFEVVDEIKEQTGVVATVFMGDVRVATNVVTKNGTRAVGTRVSPEVAKKVLRLGEDYLGEADVVGKKYQTMYSPLRDAAGKVVGIWFVGVENSVLQREIRSLSLSMLGTIIAVLAAGIFLSLLLAKGILKAVPSLVKGFEQAAKGDLTITVPVMTNDEIGRLANGFNQMVREQNQSLSKVLQTAEHVRSAATEINEGNQDLSQRTQEQASTLEEIASTVEEITSSIHLTASNSEQADQISQTTMNVVHEGRRSSKKPWRQWSRLILVVNRSLTLSKLSMILLSKQTCWL